MSDDTPTQRLPEQNAPGEIYEELGEERQKSRGLLIGLIVAGALLVAAIAVIVIIFLGKGAGANQADPTTVPTDSSSPVATDTSAPSDTPSDTPTPQPTETQAPPPPPPPPATGAAFTSFSPKSQVACSKGGPGFTPDPPAIQISWATVRADSAWIVQGTSDAADSQFMQIPLNGNQSNFQYTLQFPCFQANATYTITLVGTDGKHVSKSWKVTNTGDKD